MHPWLESYPTTTTHPVDPQHRILRYPLTKSAVLSPQTSIQVVFPRPTVFIPSSRSSSNSSGSSPEFLTEDTNKRFISTKSPTMPLQQPPSFSNRTLPHGRPLPQVPPLPLSLVPIQPPANTPSNCGSLPNPSPITSPSSPTTLHRPKRALPIIPPSPRTPHMTGHSHLSDSPATQSHGSSDAPTPSQSAPAEHISKAHVNPSVDLSSNTSLMHHLSPLRQQPQTRIATRRVNAEPSSSKVQLSPQSPVSLDDLLQPLPPPRPKLTVQTPPLARAVTDHSHRESFSNDRPKLRLQTPLTEPESATLNRAGYRLPRRAQPLPRVPIETETATEVPALPRRASLDSLTIRSSALLSPGQALSPYVSKRPRSRRFSRNPQLHSSSNTVPGSGPANVSSLGITESRNTDRNDQTLAPGGDIEPISPMKFVRDDSDDELDDEDDEYRWNESTAGRGSHSLPQSPATQYDGVLILSNSVILNSTADEVIDKRLGRIRRRHGDTVIRAFDIDPRIPLENDKGKARAQGVGRFVLSEGEEGETDDDDEFYHPSPKPAYRAIGDYQNFVSDSGYGYGHEQAQDISGQPEIYGNPHFVGTAYEYHQAPGDMVDIMADEDSDPDASGDADNKTPAATSPPRSVPGGFGIEDVMVFKKPEAILEDLDDDDEPPYRESHVVTNARSLVPNDPVSSDSDVALGLYPSRGGSFQGTPPHSSRESATSKSFMKHMLRRSVANHSLSSDKFGSPPSASSSSSSFITPPPSSFQDLGFPQTQSIGPPVSIKKHFGRRWFKERGGQKWEERDYEEVIGSLKKSA
ncbi:hypothetical protein BJ322DRAFT_1113544 [Thelephora terrestris]|uniref:Uncharacterized protein n=1 Tax=Thelephora terrestris TaxID=56493 RepID=A0A9P6H4C6_9AGAM|nr:hypothetical protein BJ322DRAFT_1113544 [Thelephora terrestris]